VAAEWDTLLEEDKQAHIAFMQRLVLDPPVKPDYYRAASLMVAVYYFDASVMLVITQNE